MDTVLKCPRCDSEVPSQARFCPTCGAPVAERPRAERRLVTVMFGDLTGFTALSESRDTEEVKSLVDATFAKVADIVGRFGGHIDKVIGDEIMAVFGAPQAHEDDPARAVRAALAIQTELGRANDGRSVPLRMHIGINTGEVVAGFVGGSDAYTVLGDAVNTARRIQEVAAPGQILVGQTTRDATDHQISYRALGRVQAKGKRAPVAVFEARGESDLPGARVRSDAPLVGRDEELALLDTALAMVRRDRRPILVGIVGDAGLGKSRLADEFAARARTRGVRVLAGRSLPYETASSTAAVEEMVRGALVMETAGYADPELARAWVRERLKTLGAASDPDHVLGFLGLSDSGVRGGRVDLLETAWSLLEELAAQEGALVLILHEMQWADDAVLAFARDLPLTGRAPILAVCVARPEFLDRLPAGTIRPGMMALNLEPLPRERAEELLDLLAPGLHPAIRGSVLDRAGGNPFFIEELARLMVSHGSGEALQVPGSVQALVTARLDALTEREKRTLQDASVIGARFWAGALEHLGAKDAAATLADLASAAWIDPERESTVPGQIEYRFRQAIVRDVAYASVPKQERAVQHASVGAWLEEVTTGLAEPAAFYDLVAHHYERAAALAAEVGATLDGADERAAHYLERAGAHALSLDAAAAAADFLERALAFGGEPEHELRRRVLHADALVGSFQTTRAPAALDRAQALAEELGDVTARAKALRLRADLLRMQGDFAGAAGPLAEAVEAARLSGDEREIAESLRSVGLLDLPMGNWRHAAEALAEAAQRYRALGEPRGEAWCLTNLGNADTYLRRLDDAEEHLTAALQLFKRLGDGEGVGFTLASRALARLMAGRAAGAIADVDAASAPALSDRFGLRTSTATRSAFSTAIKAGAHLVLGHLETAVREAPVDVEGGVLLARWARMLSGFSTFLASYLEGDLASAQAAIDAGRDAAMATEPIGAFVFDAASGLLEIERGDPQAALKIVTPLESSALGRGAPIRFVVAKALHAAGRTDEALAYIEQDPGSPALGLISPAWTVSLRAEILAEVGDPRAADAAREAADSAGEEAIARAMALRALARATHGTPQGAAALAEAVAHAEGLEWRTEQARLRSM